MSQRHVPIWPNACVPWSYVVLLAVMTSLLFAQGASRHLRTFGAIDNNQNKARSPDLKENIEDTGQFFSQAQMEEIQIENGQNVGFDEPQAVKTAIRTGFNLSSNQNEPTMTSQVQHRKHTHLQDHHTQEKHKSNHRRRHFEDTRYIPRKQQKDLLDMLVQLQKLEEEKQGLPHSRAEEAEVDIYFEDDILLTPEQAHILLEDYQREHRKRRKRKLDAPLAKRWELPIPYTFDGNHSPDEKRRIYEALAYWQERTCIDFVEDPKAEHKMFFVRGRGCWSYVGFTYNENQTLSIGEGCQSNGTIAHEVGHAIGFWHEHTRPDRDDHVYINTMNVSKGKLYNFDRRTWGEIVTLDIPYDLGSDMHYGSKFYSKDENSTLSTMTTRDPRMWRVIGQRQELSFYDVKLANRAYCKNTCDNVTLAEPCRRDGYQDPRDCTRCRCPDGFGGRYCETYEQPRNAMFCGGVLDARYNGTIFSPNYPSDYGADVECSWLIKAPAKSHVYLKFIGDFGIAGHTDVCKDYVEVRYNSSLSLTGARYCCDALPTEVIMSDSHEMLVLFRSFRDSRVCDDVKYPWKCQMTFTGFQAFFWTQSCGGCQNQNEQIQPACTTRIKYSCEQRWQEKVPMDCPAWWYTSGCGFTTVTRTRTATCFRDQYYCCDGYEADGNMCKAEYMRTNRVPPAQPTEPRMDDPTLPIVPSTYPVPYSRWSEWSAWGTCSKSCGGGIMQRTRYCIAKNFCGTSDTQVDRRPCNMQPCFRKCPVKKRVLCDYWTTCTKTVYESCHPYCYSGYTLYSGRCVPGNSPPAA